MVEKARAKVKCTKDSEFQPERGEQRRFGGYCNWCWRVGHKEAQCWQNQEYTKSNLPQDPLQRDTREWTNSAKKGQGHNQPKGKGEGEGKGKEPAGIHELKLDRTTGEMRLAVGCRDDRPIVDSGSVVSTCPVDYAMSVPKKKIVTKESIIIPIWKVCLENHCNIVVSSAMSHSSTEKVAP